MTSKVGGRLALMVAAGLIAYFAEPLHAALKSREAEAVAAQTAGWLGDTLAPSDVMTMRPLAAGRTSAVPVNRAQPTRVAQAQVTGSEQISDTDRAFAGAGQTIGMASAPIAKSAVRVAPIIVASSSDTWDQTSMIGKIFVGIGACLTLASAARMFMA